MLMVSLRGHPRSYSALIQLKASSSRNRRRDRFGPMGKTVETASTAIKRTSYYFVARAGLTTTLTGECLRKTASSSAFARWSPCTARRQPRMETAALPSPVCINQGGRIHCGRSRISETQWTRRSRGEPGRKSCCERDDKGFGNPVARRECESSACNSRTSEVRDG